MIDKKEIDRGRLREAFFSAFDRSRFGHALGKLATGKDVLGFEPIGGGMHFQCWRAVTPGQGTGMDLVVKLGTPLLLKELGNPSAWGESISRLAATVPLLPPVQVLPVKSGLLGGIGLVMPFAPDAVESCAPWWQPLVDQLRSFYREIEKVDFALGDVPQMGSWDGIPFLVDLSDLRSTHQPTHLDFNESSMRR